MQAQAECAVGRERARQLSARLLAAPTVLDALDAELSQPNAATHATHSGLAHWLRVLHNSRPRFRLSRATMKASSSMRFTPQATRRKDAVVPF